MPNKEITTDFADGFRTGFELARTQLQAAVEKALTEHTSVRKAMKSVEVPAPMREPTGLEYRGG
jgi:hypothetical protein